MAGTGTTDCARLRLRVHLTNVTAPGPAQVVQSLLPALEHCPGAQVAEIYLPDRGELAGYERHASGPAPRRYRRLLPAPLSRVLECSVLARRFDGETLLVLGDVPLACRARQVVFVQTVHLASDVRSPDWRTAVKNSVGRWLIRRNARRVSTFIVQTDVMQALLEQTYPQTRHKIMVIPQPPPAWLLESGLQRTGRVASAGERLDLFYPAASHPHKNHELLARIRAADAADWPLRRLTLTIAPAANPNRTVEWIHCAGFLPPAEMLANYGRTDGVLFLSKAESYGMPLVEAMRVGLPVIAPDLPYARTLCGEQALYFAPDDAESLRQATVELRQRLGSGWWPDWSGRLSTIPATWAEVAGRFLQVAATGVTPR